MNLRERLEQPGILVALGAHDALTARIAERSGIEAIYHSGYAVSAHHHGMPDIGLVALPEIAESLRRVRLASSLPVIVDADTGFGDVPGVRRTVRVLEQCGADAIQIEDQVFPKRCGHMEGKQVVPTEQMVQKVRAACSARTKDTLVIARTDALQPHGLDEAIERANAYVDAGADLTFVDAPRTVEDVREIATRVKGRGVVNMTETGKSPTLTASQLEEIGYSIVIYPTSQTWLFVRAYEELCAELVASGTTRALADRFAPFDHVNELLGLASWQELP